MKRLAVLVLLAALATGCLGGGASQADDARDAFVEGYTNITSYIHEGERVQSVGEPDGPARTTTITTETALDHETRELRAFLVTESGGQTSNTTTYLVNDTVYSRTVRENSTGWVAFPSDAEVENTWEARDELGLYADVLRNASVDANGTETVRGEEARRIDVELDEDERIDLLVGKFRDRRSFFEQGELETFRTTVWITDDGRLLRAETSATMMFSDQGTRSGETDIQVGLSFDDTFRYGDSPSFELPDEAANATEVRNQIR